MIEIAGPIEPSDGGLGLMLPTSRSRVAGLPAARRCRQPAAWYPTEPAAPSAVAPAVQLGPDLGMAARLGWPGWPGPRKAPK